MLIDFIDVDSIAKLEKDLDGNLFIQKDAERVVFPVDNGSYDFSGMGGTILNGNLNVREVWNEHYKEKTNLPLTLKEIERPWSDQIMPWWGTMLKSLGDIEGKKILLLGNGISSREFFFLLKGAMVVYTDLSMEGVRRAREAFHSSPLWEEYQGKIEFHAINAMRMPFPDESFDIIYGVMMVGFLPDKRAFFSEVYRCLKPHGISRFFEDAYSPTWEFFRRIWRPVKAHLLWRSMSRLDRVRSGGSPKASLGIKEESIVAMLKKDSFTKVIFIRGYLFLRIAQVFWAKIFSWDEEMLRYARPIFLLLKWIDEGLSNAAWMKRNSLPLVYGFDK